MLYSCQVLIIKRVISKLEDLIFQLGDWASRFITKLFTGRLHGLDHRRWTAYQNLDIFRRCRAILLDDVRINKAATLCPTGWWIVQYVVNFQLLWMILLQLS